MEMYYDCQCFCHCWSGSHSYPLLVSFSHWKIFIRRSHWWIFLLLSKIHPEVAPTEVKGPAGALSQICICFGIVVPSTLRMVFNISTDMPYDLDKSHLLVYILFAIPIVLALLQVILMVTVFRYDTPNMLK